MKSRIVALLFLLSAFGWSQGTGTGGGGSAGGPGGAPVAQGTAAAVTAGWPVTAGGIAESTAAWTSATAQNTTLRFTTTGYSTVTVYLNQGSTIAGGVVTFEVSDTTAFTNAYPTACAASNSSTTGTTYTLVASTNQAFDCNVTGYTAFQVRLSTAITGTATVNVGIIASAVAASQEVNAIQSTSPWVSNITQWNSQALGSPSNFGSTPGAVAVIGTNSALLNWAGTALGAPTNFGSTPGAVIAGSVNSSLFIGTTAALTGGVNGSLGVGGLAAEGASASGNPVPAGGKFETTPTVLTNGQAGVTQFDANQDTLIVLNPSSLAAIGITPVTGIAVSNIIVKASAGNLYSASVTTGATAGFLMVFNATSLPANGAVTPLECIQAPANGTYSLSFAGQPPEVYSTGITVGFSTTGCATLTASTAALFLHGSGK